MTTNKITTHVNDAAARFIEHLRTKPQFMGLASSIVEQVQLFEDAACDVLEQRWLVNAEGVQLDLLGDLVGEARQGRTDEQYRLAIAARQRLNASAGEPESIIAFIDAFTESTKISFFDLHNGACFIEFDGAATVSTVQSIADDLQKLKPAGVLIFAVQTCEPAFIAASVNDLDSDGIEADGFSSVNDLASGGCLATVSLNNQSLSQIIINDTFVDDFTSWALPPTPDTFSDDFSSWASVPAPDAFSDDFTSWP